MHYAELHAKTNFTFLTGASHPDDVVRRAAELGYEALAVTDRNSLTGDACSKRRRNGSPRLGPHDLPPRPLRLFRRPVALAAVSVASDGPPLRFRLGGQEHRVAWTVGPERIETGWWRGRRIGRDYYRVETATANRYWIFRRLRDGKWFLHGTFE